MDINGIRLCGGYIAEIIASIEGLHEHSSNPGFHFYQPRVQSDLGCERGMSIYGGVGPAVALENPKL